VLICFSKALKRFSNSSVEGGDFRGVFTGSSSLTVVLSLEEFLSDSEVSETVVLLVSAFSDSLFLGD